VDLVSRLRALQLPSINRHIAITSLQDADRDDIVQPPVLRAASLELHTEVNSAVRLGRAAGANKDVRAVVRLQLVPSIG